MNAQGTQVTNLQNQINAQGTQVTSLQNQMNALGISKVFYGWFHWTDASNNVDIVSDNIQVIPCGCDSYDDVHYCQWRVMVPNDTFFEKPYCFLTMNASNLPDDSLSISAGVSCTNANDLISSSPTHMVIRVFSYVNGTLDNQGIKFICFH